MNTDRTENEAPLITAPAIYVESTAAEDEDGTDCVVISFAERDDPTDVQLLSLAPESALELVISVLCDLESMGSRRAGEILDAYLDQD